MEKVQMLQSWIRHAKNKWMFYKAHQHWVWQYRVVLNASSYTHNNCNFVHSPEPNQITKLKLPSTSHTLDLVDLGAKET